MSLTPGTKLGPYEVLAPLGAGGMGEVYKAKDTRLDRTVAIKVLPSHLSDNPQLKERFEREARAVSSLNHPNICTLHDIGSEDGVDFMVMEHIEGQTLADRLQKGALPLEEALKHGVEVADALDKAHHHGVVHRDLKPGNIMLTKSGAKLLDFGLAKMTAAGTAAAGLSALPTEAKPLTQEGSILGTFQYMAPEQLEGKEADARTDIFAFGSVLYEMVTGKKAFEGKSQASLIGAIMGQDPTPVSVIQATSPPALDHVIKTCLGKDPDKRWQQAADIQRQLEWIRSGVRLEGAAAVPKTNRERLAWIAAAVAMVVALTSILWPTAHDTSVTRVQVGLPAGQELTGFLDISRDGRRLAYTAKALVGPSRLYVRSLDSFEPRLVDNTEGAFAPFISPDGEWVGFFANSKLWRVAFSGGEPIEIAEAANPNGGSWGEDDSILFATANSGLARVSSAGGPVETLTTLDNAEGGYGHAWPQWLPGNQRVLFSVWRAEEPLRNGAAVLSLEDRTWNFVFEENASGARYVDTGHLLYTYGAGSDLMGVPFDLEKLEVTGAPVPILDVYYRTGFGHSPFAVSRTGTLAFNPEDPAKRTLVWLDREGRETPLAAEQGQYDFPRISPEGVRVAFEDARQLWVMDLDRGSRTRLMSKALNTNPVWTPDGESILFSSNRARRWFVYSKSVRATGQPELVVAEHSLHPFSVSQDGNIAAVQLNPGTGGDIWTVQLGEEPQPFLVSPFMDTQPQLSPDGRFLAYISDESGRPEVYVQPYPATGDRWPISTDGGTEPLWSRDGKELFYRHGNTVLAVDIRTAPDFAPGVPRPLFDGDYVHTLANRAREYDVSPDGQRFLMIRREPEAIPTHINVVFNWTEELKRLVPTD